MGSIGFHTLRLAKKRPENQVTSITGRSRSFRKFPAGTDRRATSICSRLSIYTRSLIGHNIRTIYIHVLISGEAIFCYKCESYRDFRCLDPFDFQPHIQINCDFEPFVRDRKPVFCEKTTELGELVYYNKCGYFLTNQAWFKVARRQKIDRLVQCEITFLKH